MGLESGINEMTVNCPLKNNQKDALVCIYRCPLRTKIKCREYLAQYEKLLLLEIEDKYRERYGEPVIVVPGALRKRRKRRTKLEMECARAKEGN